MLIQSIAKALPTITILWGDRHWNHTYDTNRTYTRTRTSKERDTSTHEYSTRTLLHWPNDHLPHITFDRTHTQQCTHTNVEGARHTLRTHAYNTKRATTVHTWMECPSTECVWQVRHRWCLCPCATATMNTIGIARQAQRWCTMLWIHNPFRIYGNSIPPGTNLPKKNRE